MHCHGPCFWYKIISINILGGTLRQQINSKAQLKFQPNEIKSLIDQLVFGVKYLHQNNVVHRDLKPDNIFLTSDRYVKFGDFGLASVLQMGDYTKIDMGSLKYMAPEIIKTQPTKFEPDIWSLGCIIYEIITLTQAFNGPIPYKIQKKIRKGRYNKDLLNEANHGSEGLSKLVQSMLTVDRKHRPDIFTISGNYLYSVYIYS